MGLIISVELLCPKLGYDACYDRRSGWPLLLSTKKLHACSASLWEERDGVAVARGFERGIRQFALMHDAHDANFGTTWLIDATKGVEFAKQELSVYCGVRATCLAIVECPRHSSLEPNESLDNASYYIKLTECTDANLLEAPRFLVVYKRDVEPCSAGLLVMNCVDMHGSFTLLASPGERLETITLKVQKLRNIHNARLTDYFDSEHDNVFNYSYRKAHVIVSGTFIAPAPASITALCSACNVVTAMTNASTLHL